MTPDQMAELAARLRDHANLHREHLPQDHEQQQWTDDLDRAADLIEQMAQAEPVAWLHDVVLDDCEPDQMLSFSPGNLPLEGVGGFRSIGRRLLYLAPPVREPLSEQEIWDAVEHGVIGGIGLISKAVKIARAIEQAHGIGSEK